MAIVSDVEIRLRADIARLRQDMERARQEVNRPLAQMSRAVEQFKGLLAGIGAGLGLSALVGQLVGAQREFDKLNAALVAVTGSTKNAKEVFAAIQDFAARTPYSVSQVTEAFLKLRNLGLTPSERALSSYGNTASAMGKDLNQLIEAVADAATGEFERLKEFGIKSKQQGDQVAFTFQGTTTTVKNSADDIEKYLMRIGEVNFAGAMALQANTLNGDLSALGDTWNQTLIAFNQSGFGDSAREGVTSLSGALVDLQAIMKAVAGEATKEGEAVSGLGPLHEGLTMIFEALTVIGTNVAYTFETIGKDIGVFAGQAGILFSRGFAGILDGSTLRLVQEVGRARVEEAEEERRQVDATSVAILGAAKKAAEARRADAESRKKNTSDVLGEYKILDAASQDYLISLKNLQDQRARGSISEAAYITKVADLAKSTYSAQIKREEALTDAQQKAAKKAADTRTKATNDQLNAYKALIDAAQQQAFQTEREVMGLAALTKSQEMAMALDKGLADGKIVLTAKQEAYYRALIETIGANEDTIKANEKAKASAENVRKAVEELDASRRQTIDSARTEAESAEQLVATFGMTAQAIEMVTVSRLEDRLARRVDLELDEKEIAYLTELIELKRRSATATGQLDELKKTRDMWESIDKTAHDTFVSILDGGKSAATRLKDTFKNVFFDWLYQQTLKKWIINLQGSVSTDSAGGALSSFANMFTGASGGGSSGGGFLGGATNLLSIGKTIYQGFTGGLMTSLGTTITSLGTTFGSAAVAEFGAGMSGVAGTNLAAGSAASAGASAASAIPIIGWIIAGMKASDGFFKQGFDMQNGTVKDPLQLGSGIKLVDNIFRGIGLSNTAANIFSGQAVFAKLFGRANPVTESAGVKVGFDANGAYGHNYANILEKGGIFRSDKRYSVASGLNTEFLDGLTDAFEQMRDVTGALGNVIGVTGVDMEKFSKIIDITWDKDATKREQQVADMLTALGNDLATYLVPNIAQFATAGETAATTLQRLATEVASTDAILNALGVTAQQAFGAVGVASIEARERLIKLAGGIEAMASQVDFFNANFLTEAERLAPVQKQVAEQMAALGMAGVTTVEQFKAAVMGLAASGALATEQGAKTYSALLALAPAFKTVADAAALAAQAAADQAKAAEEAAAAQAEATAALEEAKVAALRAAVDDAFQALQRSVDARKGALTAAFEEVMAGIDAAITKTSTKVDGLQSLASALRGASSQVGGAGSREVAQSQIQAALAIAKAGGVLPTADSLRDALAALGQDMSGRFSSLVDFQRDQVRTQNNLEELAGLTDTELTIAQRQLAALQDQKDAAQKAYDAELMRLDALLSSAQRQLDAINGVNTSVMAVAEALAAFVGSVKGAISNPTIGGQQTTTDRSRIESLYMEVLGRAGEEAGIQAWLNARAAGQSWEDIRGGFYSSNEYRDLSGNNRQQTSTMAAGDSEVVAELRAMNARMANVENATAGTREILDSVTAGGNAMLVES